MRTFLSTAVLLTLTLSASAQTPTKTMPKVAGLDKYPGFRPMTPEEIRWFVPTPNDAPPLPYSKKPGDPDPQSGFTFSWHINDKTGELLYKNLGPHGIKLDFRKEGLKITNDKTMPRTAKPADAPWLPQAEQDRLRAMMPKGVPVSDNLKFYKLPQKWQRLYTMNGGVPYRDIHPVTNEDHPWHVSGGMHLADRSEWYNATALDLPSDIAVWEESMEVGAFGPVPKVLWKFPEGTLAYDVLIRKSGNKEHVFEARVHEKLDNDTWDGGTVYRPKVDLTGAEKKEHSWSFPNANINGKGTVNVVAKIDPNIEFAFGRSIAVDDHFTPKNYFGAGVACNTCHNQVSKITGYGTATRGGDGRFSWHPFDARGGIDKRWPIAMNGKPKTVKSWEEREPAESTPVQIIEQPYDAFQPQMQRRGGLFRRFR